MGECEIYMKEMSFTSPFSSFCIFLLVDEQRAYLYLISYSICRRYSPVYTYFLIPIAPRLLLASYWVLPPFQCNIHTVIPSG